MIHTILYIIGLLVIGNILGSQASALDAPHINLPGYTVSCGSCHWISGGQNPPWGSVNYPDPKDNTINNRRCGACHDGSVAPKKTTHSSFITASKYWLTSGGWSTQCTDCHNGHDQRQQRGWGSLSFAATGAVPVIAGWNTSASTTTVLLPSPPSADYLGYYFMPDKGTPVFYKVLSGTWNTTSIKVRGQVQTSSALFKPNGYAFVYARNIKDKITYKNPQGIIVGSSEVKLFGPEGSRGPGDQLHTDTSVCYVCHTKASPPASIAEHAAVPSARCSSCHYHDEGFKGACNTCHGFPPVDAGSLVTNPLPTGSVTAGAHELHVTERGIGCAACHVNSAGSGPTHNNNRVISMGFSWYSTAGGSYNGQAAVLYDSSDSGMTTVSRGGLRQCSNVYCHGATMAPNGGTRTTATWASAGSGTCGTCHGATAAATPMLGSHYKHARANMDGYGYACALCHKTPPADTTLHVNNRSEVVFSADAKTTGGSYSGTPSVLDSYGTCSNIYCHSTVQTSPPGGSPAYRTTPQWGLSSTLNCSGCHLYFGASDPPLTGSHAKHFAYPEPQECYVCHNWSNSNDSCMACHDDATILPRRDKHANGSIDVVFSPRTGGSYSGTQAPGDAYGKCFNTYCHSNGTSVASGTIPANASPNWGTGTLTCSGCHGYPPSYANNSPKANSHPEHINKTCENCHYATSGNWGSITSYAKHLNRSYDVTPAPWVTFSYGFSTSGGSCSIISCHGGSTGTWGVRINCNSCHGYPPVPSDGLNINDSGDGGKGVHVTSGQATNPYGIGGHIINSSLLNPATDVYGNMSTGYKECAKCHDAGTHGNGTVDIKIYTGSWSVSTPKGFYQRNSGFGIGLPAYNGVPGDIGTQKTCSNIICHQGDTPRWSCPGGE